MKRDQATDNYFPVVMFITLYKLGLFSLWVKTYDETVQMTACDLFRGADA